MTIRVVHVGLGPIGVAVANFYPSVKLSGSLGLQSIQPWQMFNLNARAYAVGHGITIPIFEGGRSSRRRRSITRRPC